MRARRDSNPLPPGSLRRVLYQVSYGHMAPGGGFEPPSAPCGACPPLDDPGKISNLKPDVRDLPVAVGAPDVALLQFREHFRERLSR